jgi:hypothetical protein
MATLTIVATLNVNAFAFGTGEVGAAYNLTITTTGGILPLANCSFSPALPNGLTVAPMGATCVVSGTPTVTFAATTLQLTATDSGSSSTAPVSARNSASLTVNARLAVPAFALGNAEVNTAYTPGQVIPTAGGILPIQSCLLGGVTNFNGLMIAPFASGANGPGVADSCQITGTPTAAYGPTAVSVSATDSGDMTTGSPAVTATTTSSNNFQIFSALAVAVTLGNGEVGAVYSTGNAGATAPAISGGQTGVAGVTYTCMFVVAGTPTATLDGLTAGSSGTTCTVAGTPTGTFGPATVTLQVLENQAPSASSAKGMVTGVSGLITVFPALAATVPLGNGEVNAAYTNVGVAPGSTITPGNPAATSYTCTPTGAVAASLAVAWNGSVATPGCTVTGAGGGGLAAATFGPATPTIQVTESPAPSLYSAAGTVMATSNSIQIFPQVTLAAFALGAGEVNAAYSHLGIAISNGNQPYVSCAFVGTSPAGLTATINAARTACDVKNTPTAVFSATVTIQVTDTAPSVYSAAGTNTTTSTGNLTIFSQVSLAAFTLLTGEVNAAYSHLGILISNGNPPYTACAFSGPAPAGFNVALNGPRTACDVTGTPTSNTGFAPPTGATVTIMVTDTAPSGDSVAGSNTTTSSANLVILPPLTINGNPVGSLTPFTLRDGEQFAGYQNQVPINIGGGTGAYTCTMATANTGLTATASGATCQVFGAGGAAVPPDQPANAATMLFGSASVLLNVADAAPPSADSVAGVIMPTSTAFQIFPGVTFGNFTLGNGAKGFPFNQTGPPGFSGGNTAQPYTCAFSGVPVPTGLTTTWNGTAPPGALCNVTGAGGGNVATATFGPAQAMIQVKDTPRSLDQTTSSMKTANSQANFTIFPALTVVIPAVVPNGLVNVAYQGIAFTATGGLSNGANVTWTPPGSTSGSGLCTPPNSPAPLTGLPTGLSLNTSNGALTGTPTATGAFDIEVCVEDNAGAATTSTSPMGVNSAAVPIKIFGRLAFASGPGNGTVQVIDVSTNSFVTAIDNVTGGMPAGAVPGGIAVTAKGDQVYVADGANNLLIPIDPITLKVDGPFVPLPAGCATPAIPAVLATTPDPTMPGHDRLYVVCGAGTFDILVFNTSNAAMPASILDFPQPFAARGVAVQPDNARAFVIVNSPCPGPAPGFYYFDNTQTPPAVIVGVCLSPATTMASEIAVVSNNGNFYAYISRQSPPVIEVDNVNPGFPNPLTPSVASISPASNPDAIAADPTQQYVIVTLPTTSQFTMLDNISATPAQVAGAPFPLPIPGGGDMAGGVTLAPDTSGMLPFQAYFTVSGSPTVAVINDNGAPPFATNNSTIPGLTTPGSRIASIPIPAAGLHFATMTLPDAVAGRSYSLFAVIRSGTAPFTCTASGLPGGLNVAFATVPGGPPFGGSPACQIAGTAPGAGAFSVTLTVSDSSQSTPEGFNFTIRPEFAFTSPATLLNTIPGVMGRTYGAPAAISPVAATNVGVSGPGNSPLTMCTLSGTGSNTVLETKLAGTTGCSLDSTNMLLSNAQTDNLTFTATDTAITDGLTGITAVPANAISTAAPIPLVVQMPLAITGPASLPAWTVNPTNAYPTQMYAVSGGVQATLACMLTGYTSGLMVTPSPGVCALNGKPTAVTAGTSLTVTASDGGDSAVPAPTVMPSSTLTIVVNPQPTFSATTLPDAVSNTDNEVSVLGSGDTRNYTFSATISGSNTGTPPFSSTGTTGLNAANCLGLTQGAFTVGSGAQAIGGFATAPVNQSSTITCTFTINETDASGTPVSPNSFTITVHPPLRIIPTVGATVENLSMANNPAVAVSGRTYGTGAQMPLVFTAQGGLGSPTLTFNSVTSPPPTGITCTLASPTLTCATPGVTTVSGTTSSLSSLTAMDGSNGAVAADTLTPNPAITVNSAITVTPPAHIPNGLLNFTYPNSGTVTFTASGGTGSTFTWSLGNGSTGTCTAVAGQGLPTGITLNSGTGAVSGKPTAASASDTDFTFQACAMDAANSTTPAGAGTSATPFTLRVFHQYAYAADAGATPPTSGQIDVIDTSTVSAAAANPITTGAPSLPGGAAITSDGRFALFPDNGTNPAQVVVVDTITNAAITGSPFTIDAVGMTCGAPTSIATTPNPTMSNPNRAYVTCTSDAAPATSEVAVVDTSHLGDVVPTLPFVGKVTTGAASLPFGIAFLPDNSRAFVTLNALNTLMAIDNAATPAASSVSGGNPFALAADTSEPTGIVIISNGANEYAYIGKEGIGNQMGMGTYEGVEVVHINTSTSPITLTTVSGATTVQIACGGGNCTTGGPMPISLAADPTSTNVYVTLPGTSQFAVLDNTVATPVQITGSPFTFRAGDAPFGVTIPPVTSGTVLVYMTDTTTGDIRTYKDLRPSTFNMTVPTSPVGTIGIQQIVSMPIPQ